MLGRQQYPERETECRTCVGLGRWVREERIDRRNFLDGKTLTDTIVAQYIPVICECNAGAKLRARSLAEFLCLKIGDRIYSPRIKAEVVVLEPACTENHQTIVVCSMDNSDDFKMDTDRYLIEIWKKV